MKIILAEDIENLGSIGKIISVSDGYARNYLIPRKLAVPATSNNVKIWEDKLKALDKREEKEISEAKELAEKLEEITLIIKVKKGKGDKLFGSITNKDVAEALHQAEGIEIDKKNIPLKDLIKSTGVYKIKIKLHRSVEAELEVNVTE